MRPLAICGLSALLLTGCDQGAGQYGETNTLHQFDTVCSRALSWISATSSYVKTFGRPGTLATNATTTTRDACTGRN